MRRQSRKSSEAPDSDGDEVALTNGDFDRLVVYKATAIEQELCNADGTDWSVPVALVNIMQNHSFIKQIITQAVPAVLRKSVLVDLVLGVRVIVLELWLIQGLP